MILFELFQEIRKNDAPLLLNPTLPDLQAFLDGMIHYWRIHDLPETGDLELFEAFQKWVPEHFKMTPQLGWYRPIIFHAKHDAHALDLFFELWTYFLSKNTSNQKGGSFFPATPKKIIDIPSLFVDIKKRPGLYLDDATFQSLVNYLNGIYYCRAYLKWPVPQAEQPFVLFTEWIPIWYKLGGDHPWYRVCALYQSDSLHNLEEFFKLWERFDDLINKLKQARVSRENKSILKKAVWACTDMEYPDGFDLFDNLLALNLTAVERCHVLLKRAQLSKRFGNNNQSKKDVLAASAIYQKSANQSKQWWELKLMINWALDEI